MNATTSTVTPISETPKEPQQRQTAKELIAANVQSLIDQLEAGKSDALTAYLNAMSRFHNYSFGNILEIARQKPDATRVAGLYAWNQLGRRVMKGQKGIRILAPIIGFRRKKDDEAAKSKDPAAVNKPMLVGFRSAYIFDVSQTERRTTTTKVVKETEAEAVAFVVGKAVGLETGSASADYIQLYHGNASLLAESLEVVQQTSAVILAALEPPVEDKASNNSTEAEAIPDAELAQVA
jgi:hypothetical protein